MSIARFSTPAVLAPLHGWWRRFMKTTAPGRCTTHPRPQPRVHEGALHRPVHAPKPLRIVRILEAGQAPAQVGRMLISGRMADVCAELDRLAAHEAALH